MARRPSKVNVLGGVALLGALSLPMIIGGASAGGGLTCGETHRLAADTVLVMDRSGSMLYDNPDRMYYTREAAKGFIDKLSTLTDGAGLVTFGWKGYISRPGVNSQISRSEVNNVYPAPKSYNDYTTLDATLGTSFSTIKIALDGMVPDGGTPMRYGIFVAINALAGSTKSSKAIIVLSDGDYNWYGDPLARGAPGQDCWGFLCTPWQPNDSRYVSPTGQPPTLRYYPFTGLDASNQNMARYASTHGVKIYSIAVAQNISTWGRDTLRDLATQSGGVYYYAPTAADLSSVYDQIAALLPRGGKYCIKISDYPGPGFAKASVWY